MLRHLAVALSCLTVAALGGSALAKPPLDAFGDMPDIRAMELSPDGKRVAYIQRDGDTDVLVIHDLETGVGKGLAKVTDIRARQVQFVSNDYVLLIASKDTRTFGFRGRYEFSAGFAFNLKTGKYVQLLRNTEGLFPAQSGLGNVVAVDPDGLEVYMPAFMGSGAQDPSLDVLRVPLESGKGLRSGGFKGSSNTIDWIMNSRAEPVAREDFSDKAKSHEIKIHNPDGSWRSIYKVDAPLPTIRLVGTSLDGKSLIVLDTRESEFMSLYSMSMENGKISPPLMQREDAEVTDVISDINRTVYGVRYSGMYPSYQMFDPGLEADIKGVQNALSASSVYLDSWSSDWSKLLFFVDGGARAERYILLDRATKKLTAVANARPEITQADVGEVITIEYKSRDGLTIPGLVTWPTGVAAADRNNLPLIVMPHGGPKAFDSVGFDWLAQYLANEGYAVLQPNFRGSTGFGASFAQAGYGEWGRKMQDDITDGANALVKMGWADPQRICIVGWSYGGYAALAGGALTPDLYKCVASIAGVSNLRDMILDARKRYGPNSRSVTYWELLIGDLDKEGDAIDAVSPSRLADRFKAPVLLIHGESDTTVPVRQSDVMNDALRSAKKNVRYVRIPGDDHGLVDNASRRQALTELGAFLKANIGK